jgi:RND family efflux transporter MFP subunit
MAMKKRVIVVFVAVAAFAAVGASYALWRPKWPWGSAADAQATGPAPASEEPATEVELSPEKFQNAGIESVTVAKRQVQDERTVPGFIKYRSIRRVKLTAPVDAFVERVYVKPGDEVKQGTRLAELISPEVGLARAEVEKSVSELRLSSQALEWAEEITDNLNELLLFLREKPDPKTVEMEFEDKRLGTHRQAIMPPYSKYYLTRKLAAIADEALKNGAITEAAARQRAADREVALEAFLSVCETSRFEAQQARERARQTRNYDQRLVDVSRQKLRTMLGAYSDEADSADSPKEKQGLTHFALIAPFAGTVEERKAADRQRVAAGDLLFAVANTEVVEVSADIREQHWQAVSTFFHADGAEKKILKVVVPQLGEDREFDAVVDYVGRFVDPESRAIPIVALIDNANHALYPGMLARIKIPAGKPEEALVVPPSALRTHDQQKFVFVEDEREPRKFHRVDVKVGRETAEGVTIASGLSEGQRVVVRGVFLLKSELLLEPE